MIDRTTTLAWAFALLASGSATGADDAAAGSAAAKPVLFFGQSRIEVDPDGKVVAVAPASGVPEAVGAAMEKNVRSLRFEPAKKDGHAVGGVTYVRMEACAIPEGGQYRMAVKFLGNGPGSPEGGGPLALPRWPTDASATTPVEVSLAYRVGTDGEISVEAAELAGGRNRLAHDFVAASRRWLDGRHAMPEIVDGQPVATRVSTKMKFLPTVTFTGPDARRKVEAYAKAENARLEKERAAASGACALASRAPDATPAQVALDSPFKPFPIQ